MYRLIFAAAVLLTSTSAFAQLAPPEIAYASPGVKGDAIYMVNSSGGGLVKAYQGKTTLRSGAPITDIALRRDGDGGEIAFIENNVLKIQNHDAIGRGVGPAYIVTIADEPGCIPGDVDFGANGTLFVATSCSRLWTVAANATSSAGDPLIGNSPVLAIGAVGSSLLYLNGNVLKLRASDGSTTTVSPPLDSPSLRLDASTTTAFLSDRNTFQTVAIVAPNTIAAGCTQGGYATISPDGTEMIYLYRNQLLLHDSNCSGRTPSRIARGVRSFAWRAD